MPPSAGPDAPTGGAGDPRQLEDDGDTFSTAATATETTPLVRSPSSSTARTDSTPASASASAEPALGRHRLAAVVLGMTALIFLQTANLSGMAVAQGAVAADLGVSAGVPWLAGAYLVAVGAAAPPAGRLAGVFAPRALVAGASGFFALGSAVSAQAGGFVGFVAGRALAGVGGGGVLALSVVLVLRLAGGRRRGLWIGLAHSAFTVGVATGAVVFGALLDGVGWRALFLLQAPLSLAAGLAVYLGMPDETPPGAEGKTLRSKLAGIDYLGALFLTSTIVLFLYGLAGVAIEPLPIGLSALSLAIFLGIETLVAPDPLIPLSVLGSRAVLLSCLAQLCFMATRWTVLFYAPVFALAVRGLAPAAAGSVLVPTNAGFAAGGVLAGLLHVRRPGSFWAASLAALALYAFTLLALAAAGTRGAAWPAYLGVLAANGLCAGAGVTYTLAHLLHRTPAADHFVAASLLATFRGFAGSFGAAIGGGGFARDLAARLARGFEGLDGGEAGEARQEMVRRLVASPSLVFRGNLTAAEREVAIGGYEGALWALYRAAALLGVLVLLVQAGTGWSRPEPKTEAADEEGGTGEPFLGRDEE